MPYICILFWVKVELYLGHSIKYKCMHVSGAIYPGHILHRCRIINCFILS